MAIVKATLQQPVLLLYELYCLILTRPTPIRKLALWKELLCLSCLMS